MYNKLSRVAAADHRETGHLFILLAHGKIGKMFDDCSTLHLHLTFTPCLYLCAYHSISMFSAHMWDLPRRWPMQMVVV